jgi:uncharacterized protein YyaL (SSP411 family)
MPNQLIAEKSPYLLQHASNPVDWYPWGPEAFQKAEEEDRPIFLSIGYATCHWCHVMAHESFEDEEVSRLLNQSYIAIKVDREERPDIDQVYMSACQALTGRGGWPLSIFMTPGGKPFFAGTYFPKRSRMGMSGFIELLTKISELWKDDREKVLRAGDDVTRSIRAGKEGTSEIFPLDLQTLEKGKVQLARAFDPAWGGFGAAPKFPTPHHLTFLLRSLDRSKDRFTQTIVEKTLEAMRFGGIYDQIGLGFHRYSVDEKWLVPHFEKMLYDQALLAMAYTEAYQALGNPFYAQVTREIFTYVLRDMTSKERGFYSAEDADSEGREGLFYIWRAEDVQQILGSNLGDLFCRFYNITAQGNFEEGMNIPHMTRSLSEFAQSEKMEAKELEALLAEARERLFQVRRRRIHPLKDDKILTSWNGLMIAALAKGSQALSEGQYAQAAKKAADFILETMKTPEGGLYRRYRDGHLANPGYLEDYAFFIWGLIELYEATFETLYFEEAVRLQQFQFDLFWDSDQGGCYFTSRDGEMLITREKDIYDGAAPSGNSVTALNCLRLGRMTGNTAWEEKADRIFKTFSAQVAGYPMAYTQFLNAVDFILGPSQEIVITEASPGTATQEMIDLIHRAFLPRKVLLRRPEDRSSQEIIKLAPYTERMISVNQRPTVYVCENYSCRTPITDLETLSLTLIGKLPAEE